MITFTCCLIALIVGYFTYGKFVERVFGVDPSRVTPAFTKQDGVDYIPLPTWKIFMIQFLNIAGLGPIFGAIMGAKFGVASFLWIVLGSIFAGATHDFLSGMLSLRHDGESLPELIGRYLGNNFKQFMRGFTVILMILVGAVFVAGPAGLLAKLTPEYLDATFWIIVVFIYYILATLLPVDKIIGKIYPLFAIALLFMAVGILVMLFINQPPLPEITDGLGNTHPGGLPIFPIMFVSIACGAISGFHATQSPLMARCMKSEKYARPVFYGAMITEGIVALIWAAAATYFFHNNGMEENNAAVVVDSITKEWLGAVGGVLAILGVIAAPITSGDTAFRMTPEGAVVTATNHNAGINGGIANGMPVVFRTVVKPTPSIYKQQNTVDYLAKKDAQLSIQGRHDPCIVPRAAIVQTCAAALAVGDLLTARYGAAWMTHPTSFRKEDE